MYSKLFLIASILTFVVSNVFSQETNLTAKIIDSETGQALSYAQIYIPQTGRGTISALDGYFKLPELPRSEKIRISYIGYETIFITFAELKSKNTISLQKKIETLNAVNILADNTFLYDLVVRCSSTINETPLTSKTYLQLETTIDNNKIEILEAYYNGVFQGYNIKELKQKNGRFYLKPRDNSVYMSTETSLAIYSQRLFYGNEFFPKNPLELKKRKLSKSYKLRLQGVLKKENGQVIYVIDYSPFKDVEMFFEGTLWIDSATANLHKIDLKIENAQVHPFEPLHKKDSIISIALNISKNFEAKKGLMYVKSIDFDYAMIYEGFENKKVNVKSNAVLYAYDFESEFTLPKFRFTDISYKDYRNIYTVPYNDFFWDNYQDFDFRYQADKNSIYTSDVNFISNKKKKGVKKIQLFGIDYIPWSKDRITFEMLGIKYNPLYRDYITKNYLIVDIYLDVNEFDDSLNFVTETIFNPYYTEYYNLIDDQANACLNIYFDFIEVERRELNLLLAKAQNYEELFEIYDAEIAKIKSRALNLLSELDEGINIKAMESYNKMLGDKLDVKTLDYFDIYPK